MKIGVLVERIFQAAGVFARRGNPGVVIVKETDSEYTDSRTQGTREYVWQKCEHATLLLIDE